MHGFLSNRGMGEEDTKSSGASGHSVEHNMINAAARGRAKRSTFLGHDPSEYGTIAQQNAQMHENSQGLKRLGMLGHAIVDAKQRNKAEFVDNIRQRLDNPSIYGGKSGTKLHPLLQGRM